MYFGRDIFTRLTEWKQNPRRKPLLLRGARQIGKTWTLTHFGRHYFDNCAVFNFDEQPQLAEIFESTKDVRAIIKTLSLVSECPLLPQKTLIVFDEIQNCEAAFNSLKYFSEKAPEYAIVAAGSLLGVAVKYKKMTVPVGRIEVIDMYPLTFREFLRAANRRLFDFVESITKIETIPTLLLNDLDLEYKRYLVTGGLPDVAAAIIENLGTNEVDARLNSVLDMYRLDFSRYADRTDILRIGEIWRTLPSQLAKENKKFVYRIVREGARAREYEVAIQWLVEAGMVHQVYNTSKPALPLAAYTDVSAFKLYAADCGILRGLARLSSETILNDNENFVEFKGALYENAVLNSLITNGYKPQYWTSGNTAEIDFLIQNSSEIVPIEVKSGKNTSGKSLSLYIQKHAPSESVIFSLQNLSSRNGTLHCPLCLCDWIPKFLNFSESAKK